MLPWIAALAVPLCSFLKSRSTREADEERTVECILRLDALHKGISKEGFTRLEKIAAFHAQAMTIHTLLSAQFIDDDRRRRFTSDFDKLLHSYNFD